MTTESKPCARKYTCAYETKKPPSRYMLPAGLSWPDIVLMRTAQALNVLRRYLLSLTKETLHVRRDGEVVLVSSMQDRHLSNTIRLLRDRPEEAQPYLEEALKRRLNNIRDPRDLPDPLEEACRLIEMRERRWWHRILPSRVRK